MDIIVNRKLLLAALKAVGWGRWQTQTVRLVLPRKAAVLRVSATGFVAQTDVPVPMQMLGMVKNGRGPRFDTTLPLPLLQRAVAAAEDETVRLSTPQKKGGWPVVRAGAHRLELAPVGLAVGDDKKPDPLRPLQARHVALTVPATELRRTIERVGRATAMDGSRPMLTTIHFAQVDARVVASTADGFRATEQVMGPRAVFEGEELMVNAQALLRLARLLPKRDGGIVKIITDGPPERGVMDGTTVPPPWPTVTWPTLMKDGQGRTRNVGDSTLRLPAERGTWLSFKELMPAKKDARATAVVGRAALARAVRVAEGTAADGSNIMRLSMQANRLRLEVHAQEVGRFTSMVPATCAPARGGSLADVKVAMNIQYLAEALRMAGSDEVQLTVSSPTTPVIFRAVGEEADWYQVMMPMFVEWGKGPQEEAD